MDERLTLALAWVGGASLGAIFFGSLWWTIHKGVTSKRPALWFVGSLVVRTSAAVAGFYFVSGGRWERLLLCLLGFFMASLFVRQWARPYGDDPGGQRQEASRASHS